ncbi:WD repeat-containing protein 78 isoform X5 [Hippoglossus hippoglossus]|uniref:WD repeat-containing protein 78 isoform X5 n=1 Tax=Hippoglossus hippoglossus TaxID=8267 RepID=UPI00148E1CF9|nr:WD repeat-containing protein 78 isoform X5 [Hippoglossus hippoglossus]
MSSSVANEERKKRRTLVLRPSSRAVNVFASGIYGVNQGPRHTSSVLGSSSRRSFSLGGGSKVLEKSATHTPRQDARVLDEENNDVTPQPLYKADPGAVQVKGSRFFVEEICAESASDQITATGSFTRPFSRSLLGSSRISSQSTIDSMNEDIEETFSKRDMPINFPDVQGKKDTVKELVTEEMLKEVIDVYISETDSISLLDIPCYVVSVDTDDAEVIIERNNQYAEVCRNRMGNDRSMQTLNEAVKNKHVQIDGMVMVDTDAVLGISRGAERGMSLGSTASIDPDSPVKPGTMEQRKEDAESCGSPALQRLWTFSCELSRGRSVSSMAWNKKNPDLLAVGYGELVSSDLKPGLVCCWSLKNPTWPERVVHCDSAVTSLDFSANNPSQLAVGMHDGSIAIYDVQSQDKKWHVISSSECPKKHLGPVRQLRWTQQKLSLTGEEKVEVLFSVAADGRISIWFVLNSGLDCIDLMKLKRIHNMKKKAGRNKDKTESVLSALTPGLCFDFHPTDSSLYLAGTWDGHIHKCSCSNSQQFLETFRKHFCPVNCVAWCPLSPDVFLSCSSDWTIQLWKQDHLHPVLGFTSTQRAVYDIKWSPKWATVFGAVNEGQLEIWDLNSSVLDPVAVQPAATSVMMRSLLFALHTDCVLVGDSDGQVTVYQLKNLSVGESSQVDILEDLIRSAASR